MTNAVIVLVGATGGIGSAVARQLSARGARLVLAARDAGRLETLAAETGGTPHVVDATRSADVAQLFADTVAAHGRVDGVAHLVGSILLKPAHATTDDEWAETRTRNLDSAFFVLREAARVMQGTGGSIVLAASAAAQYGIANHEAIAAAKAGIIGLTLSAAATYAVRGIRVNAVAPGLVRTPAAARITGNELALKASVAMHALGRIGEPEDVAGAVTFLLDPGNTWMTGQVLGIDGGLAHVRPR